MHGSNQNKKSQMKQELALIHNQLKKGRKKMPKLPSKSKQ